MCTHVNSTALTDGTYELVLESESQQREAQLNLTEVVEDPNQSIEAQKSKPLSMTINFSIQWLLFNYCALCFLGVDWNL